MHPVQHSAALVALVTEDDGDEAVGGGDDRRREAETIVVSRFTSERGPAPSSRLDIRRRRDQNRGSSYMPHVYRPMHAIATCCSLIPSSRLADQAPGHIRPRPPPTKEPEGGECLLIASRCSARIGSFATQCSTQTMERRGHGTRARRKRLRNTRMIAERMARTSDSTRATLLRQGRSTQEHSSGERGSAGSGSS